MPKYVIDIWDSIIIWKLIKETNLNNPYFKVKI